MSEVIERLAKIETKLDQALARQIDHEVRLRSAEGKLQQAEGGWKVLASVGATAGVIGGLVVRFFPRT